MSTQTPQEDRRSGRGGLGPRRMAAYATTHPKRVLAIWGLLALVGTGAALIIVVVFTGFATGELVGFQQMGFGVAIALLVDATIVRTVVIPAVMQLLGDRNWYLPGWLEWLPNVNDEPKSAASTEETT